jgi:hypothetical protein
MRRHLSRIALPLVALAAVLLTVGCGDTMDLMRLSAELDHEYGQAHVKLAGGTHLIVTLEGAPAGPPNEKQSARGVAEYVRDHHPGYRTLEDVTVVYRTHRRYGPVGLTRSGRHTFTRAELGEPRG